MSFQRTLILLIGSLRLFLAQHRVLRDSIFEERLSIREVEVRRFWGVFAELFRAVT